MWFKIGFVYLGWRRDVKRTADTSAALSDVSGTVVIVMKLFAAILKTRSGLGSADVYFV